MPIIIWPDGNGIARMIEKEEFWKDIASPQKRGCWNCIHSYEPNGSCKINGNALIGACNAIMREDSDMHDPNNTHRRNMEKRANWMTHWEWNGK